MTADRRQRWLVLVAFAAFGAWWGTWGAVLPAVQQSAGVDDGELGAALLFVGVGALLSMRATGWALDRFGGIVLPVVVVAFGITGVGPGLVHGVIPLALVLAVLGLTSGAFDVAINTASARYESTSRRPLMNVAHALFSVGVIGTSLLAGALRQQGVTAAGVLAIAGVLLVTVAAALFVEARGGQTDVAEPSGPASSWPWWRPPTRIVVIGLLVALAFFTENAWQSWAALHLERNLAAPPQVSATGPAFFASAAAVGRFAGQWLTQRGREQRIVAAGGLLAAAGTLVAATGTTVPVVLAGIFCAGLGTSVCAPTLFSIGARNVPSEQRGAVMGSMTTLAYLGFVLAPAFVGLLARATSLRIAMAGVAVAAVILALGSGRARPGVASTAAHRLDLQ